MRADHATAIRDLGLNPDEPEFVASSLDRSVRVAVTTEEYEFWILVAQNEG